MNTKTGMQQLSVRSLFQVWLFVALMTAVVVFDEPAAGRFEMLRQIAMWSGSSSLLLIPVFCMIRGT